MTLHAGGEIAKFPREIFFRGAPLDLGPQGIPEALRAAFGDLESTFGPSKTMPGPQKVENLENGIFFVRGNFCFVSGSVQEVFGRILGLC